ncbi:MAG TPA: TonB-dependent receptor [Blastocatellia bacterium]|nr:TonB-dependent receptor [Blastocatellia bacterium]
MKRRNYLSLLVFLLLGFHPSAQAQSIFGSVQGTVTDASGAAVPGARVKARNVATGVSSEAVSNGAGLYFLGELRPGVYELEVEAGGFQKAVQRGVSLRVEDRLRADFTLTPGQVNETVEIAAGAQAVQTENNTLGRVIEETAIKQLPLSGRNAFALVLLTPGAQQSGADELPRLSGGRARTGEFVLDGSSITSPRRGQLFTQPNLDAIQEFKVQTNGLSAEFGRTVGGVVNATLKSGTNDFHGNLFEFHRNNGINARNFFSPSNAKLIQNQFGGMVGGPIIKNKLFFFGDYEGFRQRQESLFNRTLPTVKMKNGDFSEALGAVVGNDALGRDVLRNQIFDPLTTRRVTAGQVDALTGLTATTTGFVRDPFLNNIIPANRFDSPGQKLMALYPDPTRPGLAQNYTQLVPVGVGNNKFDARIDWRATDKDQVFARFSWDHQLSDTARPFAASSSGGNRGNFNRYMTGSLNWTRTISPTILNDARLSFFRGIQERLLSLNTADLGIPNLNIVGLPQVAVAGYEGLGDSQAFAPVENHMQFQNITTFVRGKHILKTGVDYRRFPINDLQLQFTGEYTFTANQTADPRNAGKTGNPMASLLLGQANGFNNSTLRGRFYYRSQYFGAFAQDDFKLSPSFTLNIGLRYDVEQNPRETRRQGSNFDLQLGRPVTMEEMGRDFIQYTDKLNFGPRVGFAWQPFGLKKTVVRSHYGIFYIPLTGRATSAFARFPADQRLGIQSDGVNAAVILSQTPPITPSVDGKGFAIDTKIERAKLGSFQQWNLDIQQEARGFLFQASYVGGVGRHLMMNQDYNVIPLEDVQLAGRGTQDMRPYSDYGFILCHCEFQNSSYNALQLGLERRYKAGLFLSASYTFSKFLDYNEDNFSSQFPQDPYNLRAERGLSQSHYPHRFSAAGVYDLPFGKWAGNKAVSYLIDGWQLSSIVTLQSGDQVWITQSANTAQTFSRQFRPNLVGNPILPENERTLLRWFNTDAFAAPPPLTYGTSPKFPNIQGPGLATVDLSLNRSFPLPFREGMKFELRGDFFNAFNRINFNAPNGSFGTPNFGRITSARSPRTIQIGAKFWF